jgi:hypothetical protein
MAIERLTVAGLYLFLLQSGCAYGLSENKDIKKTQTETFSFTFYNPKVLKAKFHTHEILYLILFMRFLVVHLQGPRQRNFNG